MGKRSIIRRNSSSSIFSYCFPLLSEAEYQNPNFFFFFLLCVSVWLLQLLIFHCVFLSSAVFFAILSLVLLTLPSTRTDRVEYDPIIDPSLRSSWAQIRQTFWFWVWKPTIIKKLILHFFSPHLYFLWIIIYIFNIFYYT